MLEPNEPKSKRLDVHLPESLDELLREAASRRGMPVQKFVLDSARQAAERALAEDDVIRLSRADQQRFAEQLLGPSPLAPAMRRAHEHHRGLIEPS